MTLCADTSLYRPPVWPLHADRSLPSLPGSKSLTQRALILGALSGARLHIQAPLISEDTQLLMQALSALGVHIEQHPHVVYIWGCQGHFPNTKAELFVGNAATAARFLIPLLCLTPGGTYTLRGTEAMHKRPMGGLLSCLEAAGAAQVTYLGAPGCLPCRLQTRGLRPGHWHLERDHSSQGISGLLMAASRVEGPTHLHLKGPESSKGFVSMTRQLLQGTWKVLDIEPTADGYRMEPLSWAPPPSYTIEADATSASYFLGLPATAPSPNASIQLPGVQPSGLQGDWAFLELLERIGLNVEVTPSGLQVQRNHRPLKGLNWDARHAPDLFMTLAALAPLLQGPTHITGLEHTRFKECNRPAATAQALRALGQTVSLTPDSLHITPAPLRAACIDPHGDHRIAMSFALLGTHRLQGSSPWLSLHTPQVCSKSFPSFFEALEQTLGFT